MKRMLARLLSAVALTLGLIAIPVSARADYAGFPDVSPDAWYVQGGYLDYVLDNDLTQGYENGRFGPGDSVSRAQVVTVLWRVAGEPVADAPDFPDCDYSDTSFYRGAVEWARSTGVVGGYDDGSFGPADDVTREQLAKMLCSYAELVAGIDTSSDCAALDQMSDAGTVSPFARVQMGWAVDRGILTGDLATGQPLARPQASATRDQVSKMITVFHRDVLGGGSGSSGGLDPNEPTVAELRDDMVRMDGRVASVERSGDELTVRLVGTSASVSAGDVVTIPESADLPFGAVMRVESVSYPGTSAGQGYVVGVGDGGVMNRPAVGVSMAASSTWDVILKGPIPALYDVFNELHINEEYRLPDLAGALGDTEKVSLHDGVVALSDPSGNLRLTLSLSLAGYGSISGSVTVEDFYAHVQYEPERDWTRPWDGTNDAYDLEVRTTFVPDVTMSLSAMPQELKKIQLLSVPIPSVSIPGTGTGVYFNAYMTIDVTGTVSFEASVSAEGSARKEFGKSVVLQGKASCTDSTQSISAQGKVGAQPSLALQVIGHPIIDFGSEAGVSASAEVESHVNYETSERLVCTKVKAWIYGQAVAELLGEDTDKLKLTLETLGQTNNPTLVELHWENGVRVPECTWKEPAATSLFETLDDYAYVYSSGAGGWGTELYLSEDGSFEGMYYDMNLGITGPSYPNGTISVCEVTGSFTEPVKLGEYVYSTKLQGLTTKWTPGDSRVVNGVRYQFTVAYGLLGGTSFRVFAPGMSEEALPDDINYVSRYDGSIDSSGKLTRYVFYSEGDGNAFVGWPLSAGGYDGLKESLGITF